MSSETPEASSPHHPHTYTLRQPQIPRGAQIPGPPRIPSNVGQHANPSSHGLSVPVMHSHPAERQSPAPHAPLTPQYPEQQPTQLAPQAQ